MITNNPMLFYRKRPFVCLIKRAYRERTVYVSCSYTKVREFYLKRFIKIYDIEMSLISELCVASNDT